MILCTATCWPLGRRIRLLPCSSVFRANSTIHSFEEGPQSEEGKEFEVSVRLLDR